MTNVVVFLTQLPKIGAQEVITYIEVVVRVMTLVKDGIADVRGDTVVEVTVPGENGILYEEEFG